MSKGNNREILDENFVESISTYDDAYQTIFQILGVAIGILGSYFMMKRILADTSLSLYDLFFFLSFLALFLFCLFLLIDNKKYIFSPHHIIIKSRFRGETRLDNIISFEYHKEVYHEKNEQQIIDIVIIWYENGSIKLDSTSIGNFYTVRNFIEKHFDLVG